MKLTNIEGNTPSHPFTFEIDGFDSMEAVEAALVEVDDVVALKVEILQRVSKPLKGSRVDVAKLVPAKVESLEGERIRMG